jgi:hypothetical protein
VDVPFSVAMTICSKFRRLHTLVCLNTRDLQLMPLTFVRLRGLTDVCRPLTDVCRPLTDVSPPLTDVCRPLTDVCRPLTDVYRPLTPTTISKNDLTDFYRNEKISSASDFSHDGSTSSCHLQLVFRACSEHAKFSPAVTVGSRTTFEARAGFVPE